MEDCKEYTKYQAAAAALSKAEATGDVDAIVKAKRAFERAARRVRDVLGPQHLSASILAMIAD